MEDTKDRLDLLLKIRLVATEFFKFKLKPIEEEVIQCGVYSFTSYVWNDLLNFSIKKNGETYYNRKYPKIEYKDNNFFFTSPDETNTIPLHNYDSSYGYIELGHITFNNYKNNLFSYSEEYYFRVTQESGSEYAGCYTFVYIDELHYIHHYLHTDIDNPYHVRFNKGKSYEMQYSYVSPYKHFATPSIERQDSDKPAFIRINEDGSIEEKHYIGGFTCRRDINKPSYIHKDKNGNFLRLEFYSDISFGNPVLTKVLIYKKGELYRKEIYSILKNYVSGYYESILDNDKIPSIETIHKNKVILDFYSCGKKTKTEKINKAMYSLNNNLFDI